MTRLLSLLVMVSLLIVACGRSDPPPLPLPSPTLTPTPGVPVGVIMQATINARAATKTASIEALRASLPPTATPVPSNTPTPEPTATPSPTATSSPSSTPQPTETPIPSPTPYLATVTRDANLRQGPGTTYASVGIALGGDVVALVARSANGEWLLVSVDGADVWIGRFLVDVDDIGSLPVEAAPAR